MKSEAEVLREHLISTHVIDWDNEALRRRDPQAMKAIHAEDHASRPHDPLFEPHEESDLSVGTAYSVAKANAKERAVREAEQHPSGVYEIVVTEKATGRVVSRWYTTEPPLELEVKVIAR